jgi:hypothetical protein
MCSTLQEFKSFGGLRYHVKKKVCRNNATDESDESDDESERRVDDAIEPLVCTYSDKVRTL